MSPPSVTVVIPNWNGLKHLPECLDSLLNQHYQRFQVVVVDNGSTDGSLNWVRETHPEVALLETGFNSGFSAAANRGIRAAATEYVALLNNDTRLAPDWLGELVAGLDDHPDFDIAASCMLLYDLPDRVNAAGDYFSLAMLAGRNRGFRQSVQSYHRPARVLGACAGAALYRRRLFAEIGWFDEDFFLMSEDTDLNIRALIAGKKCLYVPTARVWHKFRASIDTKPNWEMERLAIRNQAIVVGKDMPWPVLGSVLIVYPWRIFRTTIPVRPSKWHRIPMLVRHLPERWGPEVGGFWMGLKKRREVWSKQAIPTREIMRWLLRGAQELSPATASQAAPEGEMRH